MAATNQDGTYYANNKLTLRFTIADLDSDSSGATPLDLTGLTVKWSLSAINKKTGKHSTTPKLEKKSTTPADLTITNVSGGEIEVYVPGADTAALLGDYHQEVEVFDGAGEGAVVAVGTLTFLSNVVNT